MNQPAQVAALLLLLGSRAAAVELFVSPVGSDSNSGLSTDQAFRTIQKAADTAGPGDTVRIMAGTYVEAVGLLNSGSAGSPITFTAYSDGPVIMDGANQTSLRDAFYGWDVHHLVITGLEIKRYRFTAMTIVGSNITIRNCHVHHNGNNSPAEGQGIYVEGEQFLIENNVVTDNAPQNVHGGSGIVAFDADFTIIRNNVADRNNGNGILVEDCHDVLVEGNVSRFNVGDFGSWGTAGIWLDGGHTVIVRNNWFEGNVWAGLEITDEEPTDPYGYEIYNNVAVGNWYGIWLDGIGRDGNPLNLIYNNTFVDNTRRGVWVPWEYMVEGAATQLRRTRVYNNVVVQVASDTPALVVDSGTYSDVVFNNNLYFRQGSSLPINWAGADRTFAEYQSLSGWDASGLSVNPQFEDAVGGDFRLQADSAAIDAGSSAYVPPWDYDGHARPIGAGVDIGAFEHGQPSGNVTINWFAAVPAVIEAGGYTTLSWSVSNATLVTIDNGVGQANSTGSNVLSLAMSTTYTLTAEGPGGPVTAQATVTAFEPNPYCSAPPQGDSARLQVSGLDQVGGDQKLSFRGKFGIATPFVPPLAPHVGGARVILSERAGAVVQDLLDLDVPGGEKGGVASCGPSDGWRTNTSQTRFTYRNETGVLNPPVCPPGSAQGLAKLQIHDRIAAGRGVSVMAKGTRTSWELTGAADILFTVVFDAANCVWIKLEAGDCTQTARAVRCRRP